MVDLHSGGSSLNYIPSALAKMRGDKKLDGKLVEMLDAFAAPISYCIHGPGDDRTISGAAERVGLPAIGTELGGAGTVNIQGTRAAEDGTQRLLEYLGIVKETKLSKNRPTTRFMDLAGVDYYVYASDRGLFEPYVDLGATVKKGQPAGAIHFMDDPLREPKVVSFRRDGVVLCKRIPGQVERGDCVFHLGTDRK
jgi:predicted deacylase